jgi:hypothetical protein
MPSSVGAVAAQVVTERWRFGHGGTRPERTALAARP